MIIAIDGPAGSGKSTVAKLISKTLGIIYLDTGAIYRAVGLAALKRNINLEDEKALVELINNIKIEITSSKGEQKILLDGEDITQTIRTEEVGMAASIVSKHPMVRKELLELQRSFAKKGDLVTEGRDTTTVVFPQADVKIFLTATLEERAKRRYKEMMEKGLKTSFEEVVESIRKRDEQDSNREIAPLKPAPDAIIIDTTHLSPEEVMGIILKEAEKCLKKRQSC